MPALLGIAIADGTPAHIDATRHALAGMVRSHGARAAEALPAWHPALVPASMLLRLDDERRRNTPAEVSPSPANRTAAARLLGEVIAENSDHTLGQLLDRRVEMLGLLTVAFALWGGNLASGPLVVRVLAALGAGALPLAFGVWLARSRIGVGILGRAARRLYGSYWRQVILAHLDRASIPLAQMVQTLVAMRPKPEHIEAHRFLVVWLPQDAALAVLSLALAFDEELERRSGIESHPD